MVMMIVITVIVIMMFLFTIIAIVIIVMMLFTAAAIVIMVMFLFTTVAIVIMIMLFIRIAVVIVMIFLFAAAVMVVAFLITVTVTIVMIFVFFMGFMPIVIIVAVILMMMVAVIAVIVLIFRFLIIALPLFVPIGPAMMVALIIDKLDEYAGISIHAATGVANRDLGGKTNPPGLHRVDRLTGKACHIHGLSFKEATYNDLACENFHMGYVRPPYKNVNNLFDSRFPFWHSNVYIQ